MESQIATFEDATLILKLYELRREPVLRKARHWLVFEFNPATVEEFSAMARGTGTEENAYYRQVISYWEMAASLVVHGAVKADLFLDSNGEGLYILAKFNHFREEIKVRTGRPFMRHTAQLVEKYPTARDIFAAMLKSIEARTSNLVAGHPNTLFQTFGFLKSGDRVEEACQRTLKLCTSIGWLN